MLINTEKYIEHLKKELPDFNFLSILKIEDYKNNSEVFEVLFNKKNEEKEYSYRVLIGYLDFTEEQQLENFVKIAELTYNSRNKEEVEEIKT